MSKHQDIKVEPMLLKDTQLAAIGIYGKPVTTIFQEK